MTCCLPPYIYLYHGPTGVRQISMETCDVCEHLTEINWLIIMESLTDSAFTHIHIHKYIDIVRRTRLVYSYMLMESCFCNSFDWKQFLGWIATNGVILIGKD